MAFNLEKLGTVYDPDVAAVTDAARDTSLPPARDDDTRILLFLIDIQIDFVHEDGALSVPGALDDTRQLITWMHANMSSITTIAASLDTHIPNQIFYPGWWVNNAGEHPGPYTQISAADVDSGKWRPTREPEWSVEYVHKLESEAKKVLTIWPYHCMLGTEGHRLVPPLYEAIVHHAAARDTNPHFLIKGMIPKTEHYSIMEPEIEVQEERLGTMNMDYIRLMEAHDLIYLTGQAKSHCLLESSRSIVDYFAEHDPEMVSKLRLVEDATSPVAHPEIDFEAYANEEFAKLYDKGLQPVTLTEGIEQPG